MDDPHTTQDINIRAARAKKGCPFLTTKEAAFYLGLKPQTLIKMRMEKRGPKYRKHGRHIFYHIDGLDEWSMGQA
jgi:Helix-turn-helix domain